MIAFISRNFCWQFLRVEFCNFHTVHGKISLYSFENVWFRISNDLLFKIPSSSLHPKQKKGNWNTLKMHDLRPTFLLCAYCATFFLWPQSTGGFTCSILVSIVTILVKCCDNTYKYWVNTWKMCSPTSPLLASIVTILISVEGILKRI